MLYKPKLSLGKTKLGGMIFEKKNNKSKVEIDAFCTSFIKKKKLVFFSVLKF